MPPQGRAVPDRHSHRRDRIREPNKTTGNPASSNVGTPSEISSTLASQDTSYPHVPPHRAPPHLQAISLEAQQYADPSSIPSRQSNISTRRARRAQARADALGYTIPTLPSTAIGHWTEPDNESSSTAAPKTQSSLTPGGTIAMPRSQYKTFQDHVALDVNLRSFESPDQGLDNHYVHRFDETPLPTIPEDRPVTHRRLLPNIDQASTDGMVKDSSIPEDSPRGNAGTAGDRLSGGNQAVLANGDAAAQSPAYELTIQTWDQQELKQRVYSWLEACEGTEYSSTGWNCQLTEALDHLGDATSDVFVGLEGMCIPLSCRHQGGVWRCGQGFSVWTEGHCPVVKHCRDQSNAEDAVYSWKQLQGISTLDNQRSHQAVMPGSDPFDSQDIGSTSTLDDEADRFPFSSTSFPDFSIASEWTTVAPPKYTTNFFTSDTVDEVNLKLAEPFRNVQEEPMDSPDSSDTPIDNDSKDDSELGSSYDDGTISEVGEAYEVGSRQRSIGKVCTMVDVKCFPASGVPFALQRRQIGIPSSWRQYALPADLPETPSSYLGYYTEEALLQVLQEPATISRPPSHGMTWTPSELDFDIFSRGTKRHAADGEGGIAKRVKKD